MSTDKKFEDDYTKMMDEKVSETASSKAKEGNFAHKLGDGKFTQVNHTTMTPEKTKVVQEYCEKAFKKGKSIRQVQKDVFFKFKCKIDFKQKEQAAAPLSVVKK